MILVTGATGNIGGPLTRMLVEAGHPVRALSRDAAKAKNALPNGGVDVAQGDLTKPDTLAPALAGAKKAFFVYGASPRLADVGAAFFEAARAAGVRHVVCLSSYTVAIDPPVAIGRWHRALEERLKSTDLAWTMLRPGNFATNTLRWASMVKGQGAVFAPHASGNSAPIDPYDIAAVAFHALRDDAHHGKTHVLTGEEMLTPRDQAEKIGAAIGKPVRFVEVPEEKARAGMVAHGMPEMMAEAILELIRWNTRPEGGLRTTTVREITGRAPRTYDDWLREHARAFA
jgi:uncharacterized protein YbjT (DUF2867 family)